MADIREVIARAICRVQLNGGDPDQHAVRWNGTEMEPQSFPAWRDYRDEADHVISALDKSGMVVVPKEPTEAMRMAGWNQAHIVQSLPSTVGVTPIYRAMLAATPTLPILHGNGVEDDTAALQAMIEGKPYVDETK